MDIRCLLTGRHFSPKILEQLTGLTLENKVEVGELRKGGRKRGKPSEDGSGELCPPKDLSGKKDFGLLWIAEVLYKHIDVISSSGAESVDLIIGVWYEKQCNLVFEPEAIKLIGEMGIPLQVSCYEDY